MFKIQLDLVSLAVDGWAIVILHKPVRHGVCAVSCGVSVFATNNVSFLDEPKVVGYVSDAFQVGSNVFGWVHL